MRRSGAPPVTGKCGGSGGGQCDMTCSSRSRLMLFNSSTCTAPQIVSLAPQNLHGSNAQEGLHPVGVMQGPAINNMHTCRLSLLKLYSPGIQT